MLDSTTCNHAQPLLQQPDPCKTPYGRTFRMFLFITALYFTFFACANHYPARDEIQVAQQLAAALSAHKAPLSSFLSSKISWRPSSFHKLSRSFPGNPTSFPALGIWGLGHHHVSNSWAIAASLPYQSGILSDSVNTSSGVMMPRQIFTTGLKKERTENLVLNAMRAGFRGVDASSGRGAGEPLVGEALQWLFNFGATRDKVFVQTKFNPKFASKLYRFDPIDLQVAYSIDESLHNLELEFVDSLVLQKPYAEHSETMEAWHAMERAVEDGRVKQLGISNVESLEQLQRLYAEATLKPAVVLQKAAKRYDELEDERKLRSWCIENGIFFQQTGTFNSMRHSVSDTKIEALAAKYDVTPAVLLERYSMGLGIVSLSGVENSTRMREDLTAARVPLTANDAQTIEEVLKLSAAQQMMLGADGRRGRGRGRGRGGGRGRGRGGRGRG
eukprot:gnl/MRDRNA2_/MRDRNA2_27900_c0_seq2.p1 gnl/MRDRNA2_/MRDRNA2_27900_c0~~gnl/MRDRNA2_/MRDRNA2_27900_c0_seq2.p1  ORF type:complete len:444 (+),score=66.07 gnl/MRDRNA2_/MRDRNA2_27900_c0_seq2:145-1476(+)